MRGAAGRVGEIGQATPHADARTGPIVFRVLTHPHLLRQGDLAGLGNRDCLETVASASGPVARATEALAGSGHPPPARCWCAVTYLDLVVANAIDNWDPECVVLSRASTRAGHEGGRRRRVSPPPISTRRSTHSYPRPSHRRPPKTGAATPSHRRSGARPGACTAWSWSARSPRRAAGPAAGAPPPRPSRRVARRPSSAVGSCARFPPRRRC